MWACSQWGHGRVKAERACLAREIPASLRSRVLGCLPSYGGACGRCRLVRGWGGPPLQAAWPRCGKRSRGPRPPQAGRDRLRTSVGPNQYAGVQSNAVLARTTQQPFLTRRHGNCKGRVGLHPGACWTKAIVASKELTRHRPGGLRSTHSWQTTAGLSTSPRRAQTDWLDRVTHLTTYLHLGASLNLQPC